MARARSVDSAGSQFFVCVAPTPQLDKQYTVFGHVVTGMDAVDRIVGAPTDPTKGQDYPKNPIKVSRCEVMTGIDNLTADEQTAYHEMLQAIKTGGSTW